MSKFIKAVVIVGILLLWPEFNEFVFSQPPPPPGGDPECWPDPCPVPLDGGLSFLFAAGAAYAGKKIIDFRKKASE